MKTLIMLTMFLVSAMSYAGDSVCTEQTSDKMVTGQLEIKTDVPKYLKGATITVKLADGRETTVPAEKFKVVPRKQQFVTTDTKQEKTTNCTVTNTELLVRRNRVSLVGGRGTQHGVETTLSTPSQIDVSSKTGFVGGLQYQRVLPVLHDRLSVGVQGQDNRTGSILLGIDF